MSISSEAPWLKFYEGIPAHLDYPDKTTYALLADAARRYPDHIAYDFMNRTTTYAAVLQRVDAVAKALTALGIGKGDRFTICMPNTPQAVDCFYALSKIGAVANMVHPLSAPEEIVFYLNGSHSRGILVPDQFYEKVASIRHRLDAPVAIVVATVADELSPLMKLGYRLTQKQTKLPLSGYISWRSFLDAGKYTVLSQDAADADAPAAILYSGGTTGTAKGILLTHRNMNALALQTIAASGCKDSIAEMKMLSVMPIFHGFGLGIGIHTALVGGATCILVPRFGVKIYAKLLLKKKPNFIPGVPTLFEALLRAVGMQKADLSFLVGMFSGGDSLSEELKAKVDRFLKAHNAKIQVREGYGTTECVTASCLTPVHFAKKGSIGVPFPDTYYKITAVGTTEELPAGAEGEICISGPTVMLGYLDNPEETALVLRRHADGKIWLHTGDVGYMDTDGFVYFRQRLKRIIITSGYNVYPSQLENVIDRHEKVLQSCVIGVRDPYKMHKIKAFVVPAPGVAPSQALKEELFAYCRQCIAKYAMPYEIEFRTELPKTLVGKVDYRKLEAEEEAS